MNTPFGIFAFVSALTVMTFAGPAPSRAQETVHGLLQSGWVIVKKTQTDEWKKGAPPYAELDRLIYVVTYILKKDGKTMTCRLTRDMMYDTSEQTCSPTN